MIIFIVVCIPFAWMAHRSMERDRIVSIATCGNGYSTNKKDVNYEAIQYTIEKDPHFYPRECERIKKARDIKHKEYEAKQAEIEKQIRPIFESLCRQYEEIGGGGYSGGKSPASKQISSACKDFHHALSGYE